MSYTNIPQELQNLNQWVNWKKIIRKDKESKVLINSQTQQFAKSNDPSTWHSFQSVLDNVKNNNGIGFVLQKSNRLLFIDLDDCLTFGLTPFAENLINKLDSYTQTSISETGKHIFVRIRDGVDLSKFKVAKEKLGDSLEIYYTTRFAVMTGNCENVKPIRTLTEEQEKYLLDIIDDFNNKKPSIEQTKVDIREDIIPDEEINELTAYDILKYQDALKSITATTEDEWYNKITRGLVDEALKHPKCMKSIHYIWDEWSKTQDGYDSEENEKRWQRAIVENDKKGKKSTIANVIYMAQETGWTAKDSYSMERSGVITHYNKPKFEINVPEEYKSLLDPNYTNTNTNTNSNIIETVNTIEWLDDSILESAIDGTLLGDMVDVMRNYSDPKLPVQICLGQAMFALGTVCSGLRSNYADKGRGAIRSKIRIYGTSNPMTCSMHVLIVSPKGSGKDLVDIRSIINDTGYKCIPDCSSQGLYDISSQYPNLALYFGEFQKILNTENSSNINLQTTLKTSFTSYDYEEVLSNRENKKHKLENRNLMYFSPSILGSTQPESLRRYMLRENMDDGFMDRFIICYYENMTTAPFPNLVGKKVITDTLEHFNQINGDFKIADYPQIREMSRLLVNGDPTKSYEARMVNLHAPKLAIFLQGSLNIQPETWQRVEWICKKFIQNYHEITNDIYEDKNDAKIASKYKNLENFIRIQCLNHKAPSKTDIHNMPGGIRTIREREDALNYLIGAGRISFDDKIKRYIYINNRLNKVIKKVQFNKINKPELLKKIEIRAEEIVNTIQIPNETIVSEEDENLFN